MRISAFTPTHKPKYIPDLWKTIRKQGGDWEWIIVYNGPDAFKNFTEMNALIDDERVKHKIYEPGEDEDSEELRIGTLKKWACRQCDGEILAEVDHDDLLSDNCFDILREAFADNEIGFAYSDFAEFHHETWKPQIYGANSGWTVYPVTFEDKSLFAHRAFPPDPRSICQIEFAPNHIRAWRANIYWEIGGHADLLAGDDHEIICRTYLKTKIAYIDKCLYFYRRLPDNGNSYLKRYKEVHQQDAINRNKYLHKLVERWCDLSDLKRIDLGGAHGKPEGYIGLDVIEGATDICHDVTKGLPFEDNSIGAIRAVDFLEHIPDKIGIINEIYRVLVPGGWLLSVTPSTDGRGAFQDPTHVSFYNENSFLYYIQKRMQNYVPALNCKFQAARLLTSFPSDYHKKMNICYVYADLVAIKEGYRPPGIIDF